MNIENAVKADEEEILTLLRESGLPTQGVAEGIDRFLIARDDDGSAIASAGLEGSDDIGLIRSVAVSPDARGRGVGFAIVTALLERAKADGVRELVLLTNTAENFFHDQFDFERTDRSRYDGKLDDCCEWNLERCSSAVAMCREIATR